MASSPSPSCDNTSRAVAVLLLVGLFAVVFCLSGCTLPARASHKSSNIVDFLYPGEMRPIDQPQTPTLRLPLRVGIAFAPPGVDSYSRHGRWFTQNLSATRKQELLDNVASQFRNLGFVETIEVIPDSYLRPAGGFENLDQLQSLLGIDVVAIIAYDQAQASTDDEASILYWTVVGSYIFPTRKNETHTLMEAVVYDIRSRALLFRAPGTSGIKDRNTLIGSADELAQDSDTGFVQAADDLAKNLHAELLRFQVRLRENPESVHIERKPGYTGAGSFGGAFFAGLGLLLGWRRATRNI